VEQPGDQFLAGAGLAGHEHGLGQRRKLGDLLPDLPDGRALADQDRAGLEAGLTGLLPRSSGRGGRRLRRQTLGQRPEPGDLQAGEGHGVAQTLTQEQRVLVVQDPPEVPRGSRLLALEQAQLGPEDVQERVVSSTSTIFNSGCAAPARPAISSATASCMALSARKVGEDPPARRAWEQNSRAPAASQRCRQTAARRYSRWPGASLSPTASMACSASATRPSASSARTRY